MNVARLIEIDGEQAVEIPQEFEFSVQEVWVRRDETTGDVILSQRLQLDSLPDGKPGT